MAVGRDYSLALAKDGTVWAWGRNSDGQLGTRTGADTTSPQRLPLSSIVRISAGDTHALAFAADGRVWAWGESDVKIP